MRDVIGFIGRALITLGLLVLGFAVYQLYGTGVFVTDRAQSDLRSSFEKQLQATGTTTTVAGQPAPSTTAPPAPLPGEAVALLSIPKIGIDKIAVINGVDRPDLQKGPGHYPETPLPGQLGNSAIAGHRTTYGAPFFDLDQVEAGDTITVQTLSGTYNYKVTKTGVVQPTDVSIVGNTPGLAYLTLTTCNPKYSAKERLFVQAALDEQTSAKPTEGPASTQSGKSAEAIVIKEKGLGGDPGELTAAYQWGMLLVLIGGIWWWWFHRYHRAWIWFVGFLPFAAVLVIVYSHIERALPSGI